MSIKRKHFFPFNLFTSLSLSLFVLVISGVLFFMTCTFQVGLGESVVIKRFGCIVEVVSEEGLHFKMPYPMDQLLRFLKDEIKRIEIGFKSDISLKTFSDKSAEVQLWEIKHKSITKSPNESLMITKDENIVDSNCVVHFKIKNVRHYLTNVERPKECLKHVAESSIRYFLGTLDLDDILVKDKSMIQELLENHIQGVLDRYESGIEITAVNFQDVHPPVDVVFAFRDVASAKEDKNTLVYNAQGYQAQVVPLARGRAAGVIFTAEGYRADKILRSAGDSKKLGMIGGIYKKYSKYLKRKEYYDMAQQTYAYPKLYIVSPELLERLEIISQLDDLLLEN